LIGPPKELDPKTWQQANKKGELDDLLGDLTTAKGQHNTIKDYPLVPKKANRNQADLWVKSGIAFFKGMQMKQLVGAFACDREA
jgi:hypothetical protein